MNNLKKIVFWAFIYSFLFLGLHGSESVRQSTIFPQKAGDYGVDPKGSMWFKVGMGADEAKWLFYRHTSVKNWHLAKIFWVQDPDTMFTSDPLFKEMEECYSKVKTWINSKRPASWQEGGCLVVPEGEDSGLNWTCVLVRAPSARKGANYKAWRALKNALLCAKEQASIETIDVTLPPHLEADHKKAIDLVVQTVGDWHKDENKDVKVNGLYVYAPNNKQLFDHGFQAIQKVAQGQDVFRFSQKSNRRKLVIASGDHAVSSDDESCVYGTRKEVKSGTGKRPLRRKKKRGLPWKRVDIDSSDEQESSGSPKDNDGFFATLSANRNAFIGCVLTVIASAVGLVRLKKWYVNRKKKKRPQLPVGIRATQ